MRIANTSLGDQVAQELRQRIFTGALPGGELLIEGSLSEEFGVSRGPVRDALVQLREDGLITQQGRSSRVVEVDEALIHELYELRFALETHCIERARRHDEDLSTAREQINAMRTAADGADPAAFNDADLAFHGAFFAAGGYIARSHIWHVFERVLRALLEINPHPTGDLPRAAEEHARIFDAIVADGDWRGLLADHMDEAVARLSS